MTLSVTHPFASAIADGADATLVRPSNWNAAHTLTGAADVTQGGTGLTSGTSGGIPYFNAATSMLSSALLVASALMLGGGAGAAPSTPVGLGTTTTVLHGNAAGNPSWGAVNLAADVTGQLPYAGIQNVSATSRFLGRISAGAGTIEELTGTQATTLLNVFTSTLQGLVPGSGGGTTNFLRADGTWAASGGAPGGASLTVQYNNAGVFNGMSGSSWDDTNRALTLTGATVTASNPILNLSQTWNSVATTGASGTGTTATLTFATQPTAIAVGTTITVAGVTPTGYNGNYTVTASTTTSVSYANTTTGAQTVAGTVAAQFSGLKFNVTNTASAATLATHVFDFQIGGVSFLSAGSDGNVTINQQTGALSSSMLDVQFQGTSRFQVQTAGVNIPGTGSINFGAIATLISWGGGPQLIGFGSGSNFGLDMRSGALTQTLRVYNTADSGTGQPTNYERGVFDWQTTANTLTIATQAGGTGTLRNLDLVAGTTDINVNANGDIVFTVGATGSGRIRNSEWRCDAQLFMLDNTDDVGITKVAAGVVGFTNTNSLANHAGWMQWGGQTRVTADFSVTSSTVLVNVTGLTVNVAAGRTYSFEAHLSFTDAAAGGVQAAISGTATATDIRYDGFTVDSAANGVKGNTQAAALGTAVASTTTTGTAGCIIIRGTITVNAAGTLTVQFAQNTSNATASIVKRGSWFIVQDMP